MSRFVKGQNIGPANINWTGDNPTKSAGRQRARKLFPGYHVCEVVGCGKKAERHHKDDNTGNNDPSNIAFLCHKHHVEADGRMTRPGLREALAASRRGVPLSEEQRRKIGEAHTGMKRSEAAKRAMSEAMRASWAKKPKPTHCPRGHAYDEANTHVKKNGSRECRACARARALRLYHLRRQSESAAGGASV